MSRERAQPTGARSRVEEASNWFARMRGPEAFRSRAGFEAWLSDPDNAGAYREIEQVWTATGLAGGQARKQGAMRRPHWPRYALAAAIALVAVSLGLLVATNHRERVLQAPAAAYASQVGEIRKIRLADGSWVTLDTASRLSVNFSRSERRIALLSGRARFDVAHDAARPFVVTAGNRAVVAHGTVFDVRIEGGTVEVMLLRGKVDVQQLEGQASARRLARLLPRQKVVLRGPDPVIRVESSGAGTASWTDGLLPAESLALSALVAEANRYSVRKIVLADPQLGRLKVTGAFRPGDPAALAAKLAEALGLAFTVRQDGSVLLAAKPG